MSSPSKLVRILTTTNAAKAEVLKSALEAEGIPCMIENQLQAGFTGILPVRLFVNQANQVEAQSVLAEFERRQAADDEQDADDDSPA